MDVLRPPGLTPACICLLAGLQSRLLATSAARGRCQCLESWWGHKGSVSRPGQWRSNQIVTPMPQYE